MAVDAKVTVLLNDKVNKIEYGILGYSFPIAFKQDPDNPALYVGKFESIALSKPWLELLVHGITGFICEVNLFIDDKPYNTKPILITVNDQGNGYYDKEVPKQ